MYVLQGGTVGSSDLSSTQKDEQPAKKPHVDADLRPTESPPLSLSSLTVDDSAKTTDGENLSFFLDLTTSVDPEPSPRSPVPDGTSSNSKDTLPRVPKTHDQCRTEDRCVCTKSQQLCSDCRMLATSASSKLRADLGHDSHCPSVNGICDVSSLKVPYRNAAAVTVDANGCRDSVSDELLNDCRDQMIQTNGFPSLEAAATGVMVNGT